MSKIKIPFVDLKQRFKWIRITRHHNEWSRVGDHPSRRQKEMEFN